MILLATVAGAVGCRSRKVVEPEETAPATRGEQASDIFDANTDAKTYVARADAEGESRITPPPARWATWPMPNFPGSGLPNPQSYDVSLAGTVLDRVTGLMWQRAVGRVTMTFEAANTKCTNLELAGYRDWRLPSRIELVSILDLAEDKPSIDRSAFPNTPSDWFWSSSVAADSPTSAWYVYFYFGYPNVEERRARFSVRCVRTEKLPAFTADPDAHYEVGAASVLDLATGLRWQRAPSPHTFTYTSAIDYCRNLNLDGHKGWRLPSMPELVSIVDERRSNPAIDATAFPETPAESFWTSSRFGNKWGEAWNVYFDHGRALYGRLDGTRRVRCVG